MSKFVDILGTVIGFGVSFALIIVGGYMIFNTVNQINKDEIKLVGVYEFMPVDSDYEVKRNERKDEDGNVIEVIETDYYYLIYSAQNGDYRFKESVGKYAYKEYQEKKRNNEPMEPVERSVWNLGGNGNFRYEYKDITKDELIRNMKTELAVTRVVGIAIMSIGGVMASVFFIVKRKRK